MEQPSALYPNVSLRGFSRSLQGRKVTNDDLSQLMDTSDEWISKRTGIETRYWVEPPTTTSDLGIDAAKGTFKLTGVDTVDAIVAATLSPDYNFPGIGVQIQNGLQLPSLPAYDLRNQCSGFLYGLEMAAALVQSGTYGRILLIGAEVHSTGLDISSRGRDVAVLFGDGAGSCLVEHVDQDRSGESPNFSVLATELHSDGAYTKELWCEHPGSAHFPTRITAEIVNEGKVFPYMNGKKVFEHAVKNMVGVCRSILQQAKIQPEEIGLLVAHQANIRINQMVGHTLGLNPEQVFNTIQDYGNTTAATIPIGLSRAVEEGRLSPGDVVLCPAFGSGFTWGAVLLQVQAK